MDFVSDWEDLPDGEWLENDEHGVHWYLTNDGAHWFSTEDGYRLWVEDGDVPQDEVDESIYHEQEEDDDSITTMTTMEMVSMTKTTAMTLTRITDEWPLMCIQPRGSKTQRTAGIENVST